MESQIISAIENKVIKEKQMEIITLKSNKNKLTE